MTLRILSLLFSFILFPTLVTGQHQAVQSWLAQLPNCPCEDPDVKGVVLSDGWAKDKADIQKYHRGAATSYRSYPPIKTQQGLSGQQCCYDKAGRLIKSGSGAGTPDKVATCAGEDSQGVMRLRLGGLIGHYFKDVIPWQNAGSADIAWKTYNLVWKPNQGSMCE
ncbi:hypothetical protein L0663_05020 [Dyadobacter sp. CY107]|uniref:hypothetical protein n=1 Tax=Dyadobacter fanqingshengii TaxID=2906443 RepID=UPI001F264233|nr:hypothetical protein [Dyadobacter fanqingshengii]MCF2502728.1 hypothetical protein [Dyadobacter fanqingshengii]